MAIVYKTNVESTLKVIKGLLEHSNLTSLDLTMEIVHIMDWGTTSSVELSLEDIDEHVDLGTVRGVGNSKEDYDNYIELVEVTPLGETPFLLSVMCGGVNISKAIYFSHKTLGLTVDFYKLTKLLRLSEGIIILKDADVTSYIKTLVTESDLAEVITYLKEAPEYKNALSTVSITPDDLSYYYTPNEDGIAGGKLYGKYQGYTKAK